MKKTFKFGGLAIGACTIATIALVAYPKKADAHSMYNRMFQAMQSVSSVYIEGTGSPVAATFLCTAGHAKLSFADGQMMLINGSKGQWYTADGNPTPTSPTFKSNSGSSVPNPYDYVVSNILKNNEMHFGAPQAEEPLEANGQQYQVLTREAIAPEAPRSSDGRVRQVIAVDGQSGLPAVVWFEAFKDGAWTKTVGGFRSGNEMITMDEEKLTFNVPVAPGTFDPPTPK